MEAEFSKKMCARLEEYEAYLEKECKSPLMQKDKIVVDREPLQELLEDLKAFHSADQNLEDAGELDLETIQLTKEQILKNATWQARQIISEAEVVRTNTLEEAEEEAKKQAAQILQDVRAYESKVKTEAEDIVSMTLQERRQELEKARKELEDSRDGILQAARDEGEQILEDVREEAAALRRQLDEELDTYQGEREQEIKESLKKTYDETQAALEAKTKEALKIYTDMLRKTADAMEFLTKTYEQQVSVIKEDRKDITAIVEKLERQGLQRSKR